MNTSSYSSILRSSYLIGGAQVVFIITGLLKMKVAAVLIGPAGVGLVGLLTNLMLAVSTLAGLGMGHAGTRQIAQAHANGEPESTEKRRKALYALTACLGLLGAALLWAFRQPLTIALFNDMTYANELGWLSLGVALTVAAAGQNAWLTGLRRVGDLARVSIGTGILSTAISVLGLWLWGEQAVLLLVLSTPAVAFILGHVYAARVERAKNVAPVSLGLLAQEWRGMWQLGVSFMAAGLITLLGQLAVRALVQRELGLEAAGQFQAAWSIGMTYMGLVLGVMTSDFHPRLAGLIHNKPAAVELVNQQSDVALLLCAPMLLLLLGWSPWVVQLLYTPEFGPSVEILRWQLLGDVLKVVSLPLGFVLLASGAGKTYLLAETLGMLVFVGVVWLCLPLLGLKATGVGFALMYAVYLPVVWLVAKRLIQFKWRPALVWQLCLLMAAALSVLAISEQSQLGAAIGSTLLSVSAAGWALLKLNAYQWIERVLKKNK